MKTEFCANTEDWDELATYLQDEGNIVFPYCLEGGGSLIILINKEFLKCGTMPFGGNPEGRYYISIFKRGCDHFSANLAGEAEPNSLATRLGISVIEAKAVAQLFKALSERLV